MAATSQPRLSLRPALRGRWARLWRWLVCSLLIFGLVPGGDEVVETLVHLFHDAHLPHSAAHDEVAASEDCQQCKERGCTCLAHHCRCCTSLATLPARGPEFVLTDWHEIVSRHSAWSDRGAAHSGSAPPLRPPIG